MLRGIFFCVERWGEERMMFVQWWFFSLSSPARHFLWRWAFFLEKTGLPSLLPDFPARL
jgi:hypothetical protein